MTNHTGFGSKEKVSKSKPDSGLAGNSAGLGPLGSAKMKVDPMQRKPRKNPKSAGISTK